MSEAKAAAEKKEERRELGRYEYFKLCKDWVEVIKRSDEGKGLTQAELIQKSMSDVLSGEVTPEEIEKRRSKLKPISTDELKLDSLESVRKDEKARKK